MCYHVEGNLEKWSCQKENMSPFLCASAGPANSKKGEVKSKLNQCHGGFPIYNWRLVRGNQPSGHRVDKHDKPVETMIPANWKYQQKKLEVLRLKMRTSMPSPCSDLNAHPKVSIELQTRYNNVKPSLVDTANQPAPKRHTAFTSSCFGFSQSYKRLEKTRAMAPGVLWSEDTD